MDTAAHLCLTISAFLAAFSMPAARAALGLTLMLLLWNRLKSRTKPFLPATAWIGLAFVAWMCVVTLGWGVNPDVGGSKLHKLFWFISLPVAATVAATPVRLRHIVKAYALGAGVLSVWMITRNCWLAAKSVQGGDSGGLIAGLTHVASMADAQRLAIGILATLGVAYACVRDKRNCAWWAVLLALECAALVLTFKRGAWFSAFIFVSVFILLKAGWRYILVLAAVALLLLALPPVRARLGALRGESKPGGRITMWTKIAPALVDQHPWGIGYRALSSEMMKEIAPEVESNRNHLHSNVFQVFVEGGWFGLGIYLVWMLGAFVDAAVFAWRARLRPESDATCALTVLLMLAALAANGLVEYNFGDAELVLCYGLLMGAAAAGRRFLKEQRPI